MEDAAVIRQGKPSLDVRISVTDRCQLRCRYCTPSGGIQAPLRRTVLSFAEIADFVSQLQRSFFVRKVRLTGGDPLTRRGITRLVAMLAELDVPDLAMTTNGQRLADLAQTLQEDGLHRVNISLDSLNPETFRRITRGGCLSRTLDGIEAALRANLCPVKLNMVVMAGVNDSEMGDMLSFAVDRGCELRFLELMPIGHGAALFDGAYVSTASVMEALEPFASLTPLPVERGSSARRYCVRLGNGAEGVVGFISPCSNPFCEGCRRVRLTSDGRLFGCLARDDGMEVASLLGRRKPREVCSVAETALRRKRADRQFVQHAAMAIIGG